VVFEGANRLFGGIAAMDAWWSELKINVGVMQEGLECRWHLIVETLETRFEAMGTEDGVAGFVGGKDGGCFAFYRFGVYEVGVIQVNDK
jgi:hypothetical protein